MANVKKQVQNYYTKTQYYKGIPVTLIVYTEAHFARLKAKRFLLGETGTTQNIWIPNVYLQPDGTIKAGVNIDFVFQQAYRANKFKYANIHINPYTFQKERQS